MSKSAFEEAWMVNCTKHKKIRYLFFQTCWKCDILKHARNFREIRLALIFRKMNR